MGRGAITRLALSLIDVIPPERREQYVTRLNGLRAYAPELPRGGPVYDNVVQLLKSRRDKTLWNAPQIQTALKERGTEADQKAILNTLNYLERKGRLKRMWRGHYVVHDLGAGFITTKEIPNTDYREDLEDMY